MTQNDCVGILNHMETNRYAAQMLIDGFNQEALSVASVTVVGAGGIGSPLLYYLVAAGVGNITVIEYDKLDESNLNRQILYSSDEVGSPKLDSAVKRLKSLNPHVNIKGIGKKLTKENTDILGKPDIIVDALDNFDARFILNEYAVANDIPLIHGAIEGFYGRVTTIIPRKTACLQCMYPKRPKLEKPFPVIGTIAGVVGVIEANEVIKLLTGIGDTLAGKLLMIDMKHNSFSTIELHRQASCPICGRSPTNSHV